jgi:PIN domain nuclease of toxin-antitoxin system
VRLLLDTQIFLWFLDDESRIPIPSRDAIHAPENSILVSAAAIWEIAIKASLGRLRISSADVKRMPHFIEAAGFDELPVLGRHATGVHGLPLHHRDPFDRLMIAQTRAESLTLVSVDPVMRAYEVPIL